jgi:hypothetical protein
MNPEVASHYGLANGEFAPKHHAFFQLWQDDIKVNDSEAAAIVAFEFISTIVDQIVFGKNTIERDRIIITTVDVLMKFLVES